MCQALAVRFLAVENIALEAAKTYLKAPRKGKAVNPFIRLYSEAEPPAKKARQSNMGSTMTTPEANVPGEI
jgi:hypothetical protein